MYGTVLTDMKIVMKKCFGRNGRDMGYNWSWPHSIPEEGGSKVKKKPKKYSSLIKPIGCQQCSEKKVKKYNTKNYPLSSLPSIKYRMVQPLPEFESYTLTILPNVCFCKITHY